MTIVLLPGHSETQVPLNSAVSFVQLVHKSGLVWQVKQIGLQSSHMSIPLVVLVFGTVMFYGQDFRHED